MPSTRVVCYFVKALNFLPLFKGAQGRIGKSEDYKEFRFDRAEQEEIPVLLKQHTVLLALSLRWLPLRLQRCVRHGYKSVSDAEYRQSLTKLLGKLIKHLDETSSVKNVTTQTGNITYQEFYPATSKPILDEIDQVLARRYGFTEEEAGLHHLAKVENTPFGTRYVMEGTIETPYGRTPSMRSVWFLETGQDIPRFVTAYPLRGADDD